MSDTLRKIDAELMHLLDCRADISNPQLWELPEGFGDGTTLEDIDREIATKVRAMAQKVDGVASILLHFQDQLTLLLGPKNKDGKRSGGEVDRLLARVDQIEADEKRLKGIVAEVLEAQPLPKRGSRRLTGSTHTLTLCGNGGLEPLDIPVPAMVPDEFATFTLRVDGMTWQYILQTISLRNADLVRVMEIEATRECSNTLIREELARACKACGGRGGWLTPKVNDNDCGGEPENCEACGGTGTRGVPGARLMPRGSHVRVT